MSAPGAGSGVPSYVLRTPEQIRENERRFAEHKKKKINNLQKSINEGRLQSFKGFSPEVQKEKIDAIKKQIKNTWGPAGPQKEGEKRLYKELYGLYQEVLTNDYYKSLETKIAIKNLRRKIDANESSAKAREMAATHKKILAEINQAVKNAKAVDEVEAYLAAPNTEEEIKAKKANEEMKKIEARMAALRPKQGGKRKTLRKQKKRRQTRRRA